MAYSLQGDAVVTPHVCRMQVAQSILKGTQRGKYHLPGPDFGLNVLVSAMAGYSPRMYNVLVELLLAPILALLAWLLVPIADRVVRRSKQSQAAASD